MSQDAKVIRALYTTLYNKYMLSGYLCTETVQQRNEAQV